MNDVLEKPPRTDAATWHGEPPPMRYAGVRRSSHYVSMADGVSIAVELYLPEGLPVGATVPTILQQTRYFRAARLRRTARWLGLDEKLDQGRPGREYFVRRGYAWVHVCARGSGASGGTRPYPWSAEEIADGAEVVAWIVAQPWSNGLVGATGVSYDGTAAEMLLTNGHPAVRAIVPRFSLYDAFEDVAFPGGVHLSWFTERWGQFNAALDGNDHAAAIAGLIRHNLEAFGQHMSDGGQRRRGAGLTRFARSSRAGRALHRAAKLLTRGVAAVDGDIAAIRRAVAAHAENYDVHSGAMRLRHRDDIGLSDLRPGDSVDAFSPHIRAEALRTANAPIYSYSGWFDARYPNAAIRRFKEIRTPGSRLILGPWDHGGGQNGSPHSDNHWTAFDHDYELFAFFEPILRREQVTPAEPAVRYYTMGAEEWRSADTFPPAHVVPHVLTLQEAGGTDGGGLRVGSSERVSETTVAFDPNLGTGSRSRWRTLLGLLAPVGATPPPPSGATRRRFVGRPLADDLDVTGHPIATLWLASDTPDPAVFVYLEDEAPDGTVTVVTEGLLRLSHRGPLDRGADPLALPKRTYLAADAADMPLGEPVPVSIDLIATSYRFRAGHRVSLGIALGDAHHFRPPTTDPHAVRIVHGGDYASRLVLPVEPEPA